jgi:hypothetical protein
VPKSYEDIVQLRDELKDEYLDRHEAFRKLRNFWHGRYWDETDTKGGITSVFRDLSANKSDIGPDLKLVHNLLQEVCVKFQTYLAPLPMIQVPVDSPESQHRRHQATLKERFLYACWWENKMNRENTRAGWYLPLFGCCYQGIFPDFERNLPRVLLRSPENAFPIPSFDGRGEDGVIFSWDVRESAVKRQFPEYVRKSDRAGYKPKRGQNTDPEVNLIEYSDNDEWCRYADGQRLNGVEHDFGFNLFEHMKFIDVPGEIWGHGAVEQAVNLVEMGNALYSLMFQAVLENVFPRLILENPQKFPEEIDTGAGAVIGVNEGGKAYFLNPPVQALPAQVGFMNENERAIKQATSMPDVNFGNFNASIITGKAINELQGAGTGSVVEMVQGTGIGASLEAWNEKAIYIAQQMFREDRMEMYGVMPRSSLDMKGKGFGLSLKGKELVGSQRNVLVFSPYIGLHEKLVMNLQAMGGGLVSKQYARDQIGIPDSEAMDEEMLGEAVTDGVLGAIIAAFQQTGADAASAMDAEEQALAWLNGQTGGVGAPVAAPASLPAAGASPAGAAAGGGGAGGIPFGPIAPGAPGQVGAPALFLPPGSPQPEPSVPPGAPQTAAGGVVLDEAVTAFQSLQGVSGRVFLVGEIVQAGQTEDDIEVAVTEPGDRQVIADGLPQYAGLLHFHHVEAEPVEPHIEVTPGAEPTQGGGSGNLDELLA